MYATKSSLAIFLRLTSAIFRSYKIKRFITSAMERKEYFNAKNWALLDIEYIQCTRTHRCIRKFYILAKDGYTDLQLECIPCEPYTNQRKDIKKPSTSVKARSTSYHIIPKGLHYHVQQLQKDSTTLSKTMRSTLCSIKGVTSKKSCVTYLS